MRRFIVSLFATLALIVGGLSVVAPAQADSSSFTVVTDVSKYPIAKVAPKSNSVPKVIGGGINKPFYQWLPASYCYWSGISTRSYYCYRYGCTYFERVAWGCYDGYVRITTYTYA